MKSSPLMFLSLLSSALWSAIVVECQMSNEKTVNGELIGKYVVRICHEM
jgi:hypothetical protein